MRRKRIRDRAAFKRVEPLPLPPSLEKAFNEVEGQRPAYFDDNPAVRHVVSNGDRRKAR